MGLQMNLIMELVTGGELFDRIIEKAIKSLTLHQVHLEREQWLGEAETSEKAGAARTAQAIIRETLPIDPTADIDLMALMEKCESVIYDEQKAAPAKPSFSAVQS